MAGRGRRIVGYAEKGIPLRRPGEAVGPPMDNDDVDVEMLIQKINELEVTNVDPLVMHEAEVLFRQLCITSKGLNDVLSDLHDRALVDSSFGEKLVVALEQVSTLEIDRACVRSELLTFIQNDFQMKDLLWQTEPHKFANAVMLLGGVYDVIKIQGVPIGVLGAALLEYMELLLQGNEEQHKVLTVQLLINGRKISSSENLKPKFEILKRSLRKCLVHEDLTPKSRCWILLALDSISNQLGLLNGAIRDFYLENLGDDYLNLEYSLRGIRGNAPTQSKPCKTPSRYKNEDEFEYSNSVIEKQDIERVKSPKTMTSRNEKWSAGKAGGEKDSSPASTDREEDENDFYGIQIPKDKVKPRKSGSGEFGMENNA